MTTIEDLLPQPEQRIPPCTVHVTPHRCGAPLAERTASITVTWQPVVGPDTDWAPRLRDGRPVLVLVTAWAYEATRPYVTLAGFVPARTIPFDDFCDDSEWNDGDMDYDEEEDVYWTPRGWYEWHATEDVHRRMTDTVTAWTWAPAPLSPGQEHKLMTL